MSDKTKLPDENPWGQIYFASEKPAGWKIGSLRLWCRRIVDELWVGFVRDDSEEVFIDAEAVPPEDTQWQRWALEPSFKEGRFVPVFPDRPIVVKPEYPFRIIKGAQARIYVRVPLWVRIELVNAETSVSLVEIPTVVLSNTWFGAFTAGELCYWISSSARRHIEPDPSRPFLAICPIQIRNTAEEDLSVEKLRLSVRELSLFILDGQLWSDETHVDYRGRDEGSEIEVSRKAPSEVSVANLLTPPRNPLRRGFAARTFASLKDLSGLGTFTG